MIKRGVFLVLVLAIIFLIIAPNTISVSDDKIDSIVLQAFETEEKVEVNIYFNDLQEQGRQLATASLQDVTYEAKSVNAITAFVTKQELQALEVNPNVAKIEKEREIKVSMQDTVKITNASLVWPLQLNGNVNATGIDETVCIIDTGINYTHPDLGGCFGTGCKVIGGWDFVNNDSDPYDDQGHGTHVAGIVAAQGNLLGMAPGANIVSLKACDANRTCNTLKVTDSLNWCLGNAAVYNISVISMSFGTLPPDIYSTYCDDDYRLWADIINNATSRNISVVAATGNNYNTSFIISPSCIKNVTAVSSTTKIDTISLFSNRNNITDLFAPGANINSTKWTGGYEFRSGTSMSTPHVAGAIALLRSYIKLQSQGQVLTNQQVQDALNTTGIIINDTAGSGLYFSRISVYAAAISLDNFIPTITYIDPTPANNNQQTETSFTVNITANEPISTALVSFNATNYTMNRATSNNYHYTFSNLGIGSYFYKVHANDTANNWNTTTQRKVTITEDTTISLTYPTNGTGSPSGTQFNFTITDADGITNATWTTNGTVNNFTIIQGDVYTIDTTTWTRARYNITVNVNDSLGNQANLTRQLPITDTWIVYDYESTDLFSLNLSQPFPFILERSAYGKIDFDNNINFSTKVANQDLLDFTAETSIAHNYTMIDTSALPELNTSARITLYDLTFTTPKMMRNGAECPSDICTLVSYSGGTIVFDVTTFSTYTVDENATVSDSGDSSDSSSSGSSGSSSSSSSATTACTEVWTCATWSSCINNEQSRTCTDSASCRTINTKPITTRKCEAPLPLQITNTNQTTNITAIGPGIFGNVVRITGNVIKLGKANILYLGITAALALAVVGYFFFRRKIHIQIQQRLNQMTQNSF